MGIVRHKKVLIEQYFYETCSISFKKKIFFYFIIFNEMCLNLFTDKAKTFIFIHSFVLY